MWHNQARKSIRRHGADPSLSEAASLSATRTIRIDKGLLEIVRKLAEEEEISVNLLINRLLRKYVEWDILEAKTVTAHVTKAFLRRVMARLTEREARTLARMSIPTAVTRIRLRHGRRPIEAFLETVELYGNYSGLFRLEHSSRGEKYVLNLRHEICYKWSIFLCTIIEAIFTQIQGYNLKFKLNSDSLLVEVQPVSNFGKRTSGKSLTGTSSRTPQGAPD